MEEITKIAVYIFNSFLHIWPFLLITIPLAVYVQLSGAAQFISKVLTKRPLIAIFMATVVGAFSPFCSCGVIPVITSLLIGGVPLGPVMSFWIASPSMDPEIFFLSVATIGWKLSIWRLGSTFVISLLSGYITHYLVMSGWLGPEILRNRFVQLAKSNNKTISAYYNEIYNSISTFFRKQEKAQIGLIGTKRPAFYDQNTFCCIQIDHILTDRVTNTPGSTSDYSCQCPDNLKHNITFGKKLWKAILGSTMMVMKFMSLAFFVNALITFYIPTDYLGRIISGNGNLSILIATLIGIPAYTSNLTALPLISGLLTIGINPAAALAFMISGPTTTLPAMVAVWGIAKPKVFFLYIVLILSGALVTGYLYAFIY